MKTSIGAILGATLLSICVPAAVAAPATPLQSADPAELAEARAIIEIMFPPAQRQQMIDKMIADITAPIRQGFPKVISETPELNAIVNDFIDKSIAQQRPIMQKHMPALFDAMAQAYTREFSLAELKDVRSFAQTKSGSHYLSRSSAIIGDPAIMEVNATMFADAQAVTNVLLPAFKEKITAYLLEHPEIAAKLAPEAK